MKDSCWLELLPRKSWRGRSTPDSVMIGRKWNHVPTVPLAPGAKLLKVEVDVDPSFFLNPAVRVQLGQYINDSVTIG